MLRPHSAGDFPPPWAEPCSPAGFFGGAHALRPSIRWSWRRAAAPYALLILAPILLLENRPSLRVRASHLAQFFLLGILGLAASNYFYYFAIEKTTVATAIVLQYVAPVWVLLYMLARRLQRPPLLRISGVLLAVIGCAVAVGEVAVRGSFPWLAIVRRALQLGGSDRGGNWLPSPSPSTTFTRSTWCRSTSAGRCWCIRCSARPCSG